ncbi:MAG: hypothetical protein LKM37_08310 [Bacteroidales bacterium]|jgi:predicted small lipoprotein YifL|nr:hypothetical protein [Bacteroidales bacterium]MCI1733651.1 hypothetical protein [Bacteroidales bacterium]
MKKLFSLVLALAVCGLMISACGNKGCKDNAQAADSTAVATDSTATPNEFTGVITDAAMNSCTIVTAAGDTLNFSYPELDKSKIELPNGMVIGDTITVYKQADTVCAIKKAVAK